MLKTLEIDVLENAIIAPLESINDNSNYNIHISLIGGIYTKTGACHKSSLLKRGNITLQALKYDFVPYLNGINSHVTGKSIYGGIIDLHYGHFLIETLSRAWYFLQNTQDDIYFLLMPYANKPKLVIDLPI